MNHDPLVSIILPSLNVVSYIRQCLDSVLAQSLEEIEVICVDAGSTDGTLEVLKEYKANDRRIRLIESDKKSYGYQMNIAIDLAAGEYVGIVETDDFVPRSMYEDLHKIAKKYDLDFVKADFFRFKENEDGSLDKRLNKLSSNASFYNRIICPKDEPEVFKLIMNTWSGIYKVSFLRNHGIRHNETPGASFQDNGFWFQTFCWAKRAMFIDRPYYMNRRDNPNSSVYSKSKTYAMKSEYDYIRSIIDENLDELECFIPICNYFRFCGYYYNTLLRVSPDQRCEFIRCFSDEFRAICAACEIDPIYFSASNWRILQQIMFDPECFLAGLSSSDNAIPINESSLGYSDMNNADIAISIIVPVYNVEAYIEECINSVLTQSFGDFELICVNDGSTDSSLSILSKLEATDSRITVVDKQNEGVSVARNIGLSLSRGEYVLFLDSDDSLKPHALKQLYAFATRENADVVIFGMDIDHFGKSGSSYEWIKRKNPTSTKRFKEFSASIFFEEPSFKPFAFRDFIKRSVLSNNNIWFPELPIGEDTLFQFALFPKAHNICLLKDRLYNYRCQRDGSAMNQIKLDQARKGLFHIQVVSHAYGIWRSYGIINSCEVQFSNWAIGFFYDVFRSASENSKPLLAKSFLPVFDRIISKKEQEKLGSGAKRRILELEEWRNELTDNVLASDMEKTPMLSRESSPFFSVIIPVHNSEATIGTALDSLMRQTFDSLEIICVDDASNDGTGVVLAEYAARDPRIRVLTYRDNRTASQARKDGVLMSNGRYILFCDADDYYDVSACECLADELRKRPVDILQFETNVVSYSACKEDIEWVEQNTIPFYGTLFGRSVFDACFRKQLYRFNLWNKAYDAELAKKAFSKVKDGRFERGQDLYSFALLAYFADSYRGIGNSRFYNYCLGSGKEGNSNLTASKFKTFCSLAHVSDAIKTFLIDENAFEENVDVWRSIRSQLIGDVVNKWQKKVVDDEKGIAFDEMISMWPSWLVAEGVARRYWNTPSKLFSSLKSSSLHNRRYKTPRVVAMYYHKLTGGGVERTVERLIPVLQSLGYCVVVITDVQGASDKIKLPEGVVREVIPNYGISDPAAYFYRAHAVTTILERRNVDVLIYHSWNTSMLPWDMLTVKSAGAAFLIHCHSIFSARLLEGEAYFGEMPSVYSFADGVVCLTEVDACYWGKFNRNVHLIKNLPYGARCDARLSTLKALNILWVGRFDDEKQPKDAIRIFSIVHDSIPEATLTILGKSTSKKDELELKRLVEKFGLEGSVIFAGYVEDVSSYYLDSSIYLGTSRYEGFFLALYDAMGFGVPAVVYELPYLAIMKNNPAIIPVSQGDTQGAAGNIISLLENKNELTKMGLAAREYYNSFSEFDYCSAWSEILDSLSNPKSDNRLLAPEEELMWETLFSHYEMGIDKLRQSRPRSGSSKNDSSEAQRVRESNSYRVGRIMTWPVRKSRKLLKRIKKRLR